MGSALSTAKATHGSHITQASHALVCLAILMALATPGCSIKRMAVNKVGDALAGGGTTFSSDNDPELIKAAVPFSLKLMESLLAESPRHKGLLLATSSGFTQYGFAFVQSEASALEETDITAALEARKRAQRLYLRARDYALRGLEVAHPGFTNALYADPKTAVAQLKKRDVPQAYWAAASWAAAISVIKDNTDLFADLPKVEAIIDRALELDEAFDNGAIHSLLISYETSRASVPAAEREKRARAHFERAVALSNGQSAGPFVSLAEGLAVEQQDRAAFESLLKKALEIDPDARPELRLANIIMQKRARWLLAHEDDLIAPPAQSDEVSKSKDS